MQNRTKGSANYRINHIALETEVMIGGKKVKDVLIISLENQSGETKMFIRPKQAAASGFDWKGSAGKDLCLPTLEQVANVTGYKDGDKEVLDTVSGIFPQPFPEYICSDAQTARLNKALARKDELAFEDIRVEKAAMAKINTLKALSADDKLVLAENAEIASLL
jgi:hypothetical protein